jgi:hypothetical protein
MRRAGSERRVRAEIAGAVSALSLRVSGSGRRRNSGFITSAKCASTLITRRNQLVRMMTAEQNRQLQALESVRAGLAAIIRCLKKQISVLDKQLAALIEGQARNLERPWRRAGDALYEHAGRSPTKPLAARLSQSSAVSREISENGVDRLHAEVGRHAELDAQSGQLLLRRANSPGEVDRGDSPDLTRLLSTRTGGPCADF